MSAGHYNICKSVRRTQLNATNLQLSMQSGPITTEVMSSKTAHDEVYSIQHYVRMFASD